jgi:hypothetical protein
MATTVVRVEERTHSILRSWAEERNTSISQVVRDLVERAEADQFWQTMRMDYARLQEDPTAWHEYLAEAALLEGGSMDGLVGEEPYYTPEEEAEIVEHAKSQGW